MALNPKELCDNNEIIPYKSKIMSILTSSSTLFELVLNKPCEDIELTEELIGANYFPQLFVDNTITETQGYVLFDIEQIADRRDDTYNTYNIIFHIIVHKSIYSTGGYGTRCDCIVSEICRLFKDKFWQAEGGLGIGKTRKVYDKIMTAPTADYVARELMFYITDFDERVKKRYG